MTAQFTRIEQALEENVNSATNGNVERMVKSTCFDKILTAFFLFSQKKRGFSGKKFPFLNFFHTKNFLHKFISQKNPQQIYFSKNSFANFCHKK
jgi:hypothetical protein